MNALFIQTTAGQPQPGKALPKSPMPMQSDNGIEGINDLGISFGCRRWLL
jgi:hypothetical protein